MGGSGGGWGGREGRRRGEEGGEGGRRDTPDVLEYSHKQSHSSNITWLYTVFTILEVGAWRGMDTISRPSLCELLQGVCLLLDLDGV